MSLARLNQVTRSRKPGMKCGFCGKEIPVGSPYVWWKFRMGSRQTRCRAHPPQSWQLESNPKKAGMMRGADLVGDARMSLTIEDAIEAVDNAVAEAEQVRDEFQSALDGWESSNLTGSQMYSDFEEAVSELETWISSAEQVSIDLSNAEANGDENDPDHEESNDDDDSWLTYLEGLDDFPEPSF